MNELELLGLVGLVVFLAGWLADCFEVDRQQILADAREARRHNRAIRAILNLKG